MRQARKATHAALAASVVLIAAACGSTNTPSSSGSSSSGSQANIGGSVNLWAEWTAAEQHDFLAALQPFETQTGITVNYSGKGSNMDTALESAVQGGAPPEVALVPDPGTLQTLAKAGSIQDLTSTIGSAGSDFGAAWTQLATYNGKTYGVWFKGANKNTIWYNPAEFAAAGITSPPTSWEQLISDAAQLKAAGVTPVSLCTDVGWPLADFWQNVYLKAAGADAYNKLSTHATKWTDPTVTTAFTTMAQLVGQPSYLAGGLQGALSTAYPDCVDKVFPKPPAQPQAAMVIEADFVTSEITSNSANYTAGTTASGGAACTADPAKTPCYDFFAFPPTSAGASNAGAIQGAGDVAMMLKSTPQSKALVKYLAGPNGAEIWAHLGGFASPSKAVPSSAYPDPVAQADAKALVNASSFVFSLDDLQGSWEHNMWQDLINFVKNPSSANIATVEATMDQQATAALGH
ncbi:MAG TPA: substrate-binding domain-containing protein [Candidatus Dormibacteraeota bacterium]|nr:substrate-binding domain-containing protein [Candidatus Dormibacteraeota bacterium]